MNFAALIVRLGFIAACVLAVRLLGFPEGAGAAGVAEISKASPDARQASRQLAALDIPFVANAGELDPQVALYARTAAGTLYVARDGELTYELIDRSSGRRWALKERLLGAGASGAAVVGAALGAAEAGMAATRVVGRDAAKLHIHRFAAGTAPGSAPAQAAHRWADLGEAWPGVHVELHASGRKAEKFFHVAAGADSAQIQVGVAGAEHLSINARGELEAATGVGNAVFSAPVAWQDVDGERRAVQARYVLNGPRQYGFVLSAYDESREVVIDPLLQSTYLGGSGGDGEDRVTGLAVQESSGDVYATGQVSSLNGFPVSAGALQTTRVSMDAFVARLPADLKSFTEVTYLSGTGLNEGHAIAISPANGDIYVAGYTGSANFPGVSGGAVTDCDGSGTDTCRSAFVARLDPTLMTLRQSTLYGNGIEFQPAGQNLLKLVINASGDVYLAGSSTSNTLQGTAGGAIASEPGTNNYGNGFGFIARLAVDLKSVTQATYMAGTPLDPNGNPAGNYLQAIALDPTSGDVVVAGLSTSASLPITPGAFISVRDPSTLGPTTNPSFVARLPGTLTSIKAMSWLVMQRTDHFPSSTLAQGLAVHPSNGDIYVSGYTDGNVLIGPAGGFLTSFTLGPDLAEYIVRLAPDLTAIHDSTYIAVGSLEGNLGIRIPASGDVFSAGSACPDTTNGIQSVAGSNSNLCISRFAPDLHTLVKATFLGGSGNDFAVEFFTGKTGAAMAIRNSNGDVYIGGGTTSTDFPGTAGGAQPAVPANNVLPNNQLPIYGYIARVTADLSGTPQPGTLQFGAATYTEPDTGGNAAITVNRSGGSAGAVSVSFTTSDGTGKAGTDYTTTTQVVSFADGDTAQKTVNVPVQPNAAVVGNKTVNLALSGVTGGANLGAQSSAVLTITQTTPPTAGSVQLSAATYTVADNAGSASIGVTRSGGSAGAVSVTFATSDGTGKAGTNYTTTTQSVGFADGDTSTKTVSVPVTVAGTQGNSFTVNLTLTGSNGGAALGTPATAVLTINATTPVAPPPPSGSVTVSGKGGGGGIGLLEVLMLGALVVARLLWGRPRAMPDVAADRTVTKVGAVLLILIGMTGPARADSPVGYVGIGLGQARSDTHASDLEHKLNAAGFADAAVTLDDRKFAGKIYAGVEFNRYLALELAYVNLSKVHTTSTATTTDAAAFLAAVTAIHPYSAQGGALTALASWPVVGGLSLFARGGGFLWHGEIDADIPGVDADSTKKTELSGVVGAGVGFAFNRHVTVRAEWERYFIMRDAMDLATLGVALRF